MSKRKDELKSRLAAIGFGVEEQNAQEQSIGSGARDVSTKTENTESSGVGTPAKQNANQQEVHNEGGQTDPKKDKQSKTY
jgi:hypothetical protein